MPLRRPIFLSCTPRRATLCKPHTHNDVFSASAVKSPPYASNLVGRRLIPGETCSRRPSRKQPRVSLLSLAAPTNRARAKLHRQFRRFFHNKLCNTPASSAAPPPLQFHHPPLLAHSTPLLSSIHRALSEDIEGGKGGFTVIIL